MIFLTLVLQPDQTLLKDYQQTRILAWLNPAEYSTSEGYQQENSKMAIGSGELFGKGLNNNEISSVKTVISFPNRRRTLFSQLSGKNWDLQAAVL